MGDEVCIDINSSEREALKFRYYTTSCSTYDELCLNIDALFNHYEDVNNKCDEIKD